MNRISSFKTGKMYKTSVHIILRAYNKNPIEQKRLLEGFDLKNTISNFVYSVVLNMK